MTEDASPLLAARIHQARTPSPYLPDAARHSELHDSIEQQEGFPDARMASTGSGRRGVGGNQSSAKITFLVILSYVSDWLVLIAAALGGLFIGNANPRKRPFQLENPDIS
jgi:hypothetical protein